MTWYAAAAGVALFAAAESATCQSILRASADVSAAAIRQRGDSTTVVAPALGGELDVRKGRTAVRVTLASTLAASNRWSAQGDALVTRFAGGFSSPWEFGGSASALRFNDASAATQLSAYGRRHVDRLQWGAWGGASGGRLGRRYWNAPVIALEGGVWRRQGPLQLSLGLLTQRARLDSSPAYDFGPAPAPGAGPIPSAGTPGNAPVPTLGPPTPPPTVTAGGIRLQSFPIETLVATDATGLATWRGPRLELTASATARYAPAQSGRLLGSALAGAAWWARPTLAVTASAGTLADDPLRNVPAARFFTVGLRWRPPPPAGYDERARASFPLQATAPDPRAPAGESGVAADVVAQAGGARVLRVRAPGATRVEVRADATEWRPVALVPNGRLWELALPLEPGTQRLLLRVDGGAWAAPANLPTVEDEFGERVGLIVVP